MAHGFRKFISELFVNGKFPKLLPSENFPLYGMFLVAIYMLAWCSYEFVKCGQYKNHHTISYLEPCEIT